MPGPGAVQAQPGSELGTAPGEQGSAIGHATASPAGRAAQLAVTADSDRRARASGRGTRPSAPPSAGRATVTAVVTDADQTSVKSTPRAGGTTPAAQLRGHRSTRPSPARPRRPRCLAASRPRPRQLYARGRCGATLGGSLRPGSRRRSMVDPGTSSRPDVSVRKGALDSKCRVCRDGVTGWSRRWRMADPGPLEPGRMLLFGSVRKGANGALRLPPFGQDRREELPAMADRKVRQGRINIAAHKTHFRVDQGPRPERRTISSAEGRISERSDKAAGEGSNPCMPSPANG